ncbi:unnamed protein product [Effrenium voratum]|nr:unnamed protein product [Effrenium voratum]
MNFDTKRGLCSPLSQIVFEQFSSDGVMSFAQFRSMCQDKGFDCEDEEELAAAFVRMSGDRGTLLYSDFLSWWKNQDERQDSLRYSSSEERDLVVKIKKSFFQGTGGGTRMNIEDFNLKCYRAGYCLSEEELQEAFSQLDKDGSGYIDFPEYLRWRREDDRFAHLLHDASDQHAEYIRQVGDFFRAYDNESKGQLSVKQFQPLYESLVEQGEVSAPFETVIQEVDTNSDGQVSFNEFVKWYAETWEAPEAISEESEEESEKP